MHARFRYGPLVHYPHLAAKEVVLWDRFIKNFPDYAEEADYDVTCGEKDVLASDVPEYSRKDWEYLRSWKIDVVVIKGGGLYVIEVRPRAGLGAIGEILSKATMFQEEHPEIPEVEPVLITDEERPNVRELCATHDIAYIVV